MRAKRYDVRKLEDETMAKRLSQRISDDLAEAHHDQSTTASQSWKTLRDVTNQASAEILGFRCTMRLPWISQATLNFIEQRRTSRLTKNIIEYRRLNSARRRLLRHGHQEYVNRIALEGEDHLNECQPRDAFANFRTLERSASHATDQIAAEDGTILSDIISKLDRWKEHFDTMLNCTPATGSAHITMAVANGTEDTSIRKDSPTSRRLQMQFPG